ncbi:MAG TPA: hypothetical protein DCM08_00485 [Microscillaceae bacterium]|nr:hypothetical protein [Microscillaceae bacterium]
MRYGRSAGLGALVTLICFLGLIPYLGLQIKAIAQSFHYAALEVVLTKSVLAQTSLWADGNLYLTLGLALFTSWFGTRRTEANVHAVGIMAAVAFEGVLKLVAFLALGIMITFFWVDDWAWLSQKYQQIQTTLPQSQYFVFEGSHSYANWFLHLVLCALAFLLLPRQFQVMVVENYNETQLRKAMWGFPMYLWLLNLFVLPIACVGVVFLRHTSLPPDLILLSLPVQQGSVFWTLLAYLGGFASATGMLIVSVLALSTMLCHHIQLPLLMRLFPIEQKVQIEVGQLILAIRRFNVFFLLLTAYVYFKWAAADKGLVSIGLISFVAVAQLAPAVLGGIFWTKANKQGVVLGLCLGISVWAYGLIFPTLFQGFEVPTMAGLDGIATVFFCSITANSLAFAFLAIYSKASAEENYQAQWFVHWDKMNLKGAGYAIPAYSYKETERLEKLLSSFLGKKRTKEILNHFQEVKLHQTNRSFVNFAEGYLSSVVGIGTAKVLMRAFIDAKPVEAKAMLGMAKESQQLIMLNQQLAQKTTALAQANEKLKQNDLFKSDFISTVTHELKTPLTGIKALSEILADNPEMEHSEKAHFLETISQEIDRMERLIGQVLDLEKFESQKQVLHKVNIDLEKLLNHCLEVVKPTLKEKKIALEQIFPKTFPQLNADYDRLMQVVLNLLSNAIKFCNPQQGKVSLWVVRLDSTIQISVGDNGEGIPLPMQKHLFEKFYQTANQDHRNKKGIGLGLAISKQIVEAHQGRIWLERSSAYQETVFSIEIPISDT